jgi:hypothetical protein
MSASPDRIAKAAFDRDVDALIVAAIRAGITHFADLLRQLPSIYPTEVFRSLDRLTERGLVRVRLATQIRREAGQRAATLPEGRSLLPLPHPLDYEWRFTPDASRSLLDLAADLTPQGGNVLLFGTPGLAVEALSLPINRRLFFLAEDNVVTRRVITLNRATGSPLSIAFCSAGLPRDTTDAVLMDPPWYMDFIRPMLAAAAAACRKGGVVLISMPPTGTRPNAEDDRMATMRFAARLGLDLLEHWALAVGYDTPFFEANALAAAGIHPPSRWRRGDVLVFRKARIGSRPAPLVSGRRRDWVEVPIGRMRLFIKRGEAATETFAGLIPLIEGDVLPSVSRRDQRRRRALVWTSGNRIFSTDSPLLVLEAAISHSGAEIGSSAQPGLWGNLRETVERVGQQLLTLAALEAAEERGSLEFVPKRSRHWTSDSMSSYDRSMDTVSG